MVAHVRSVRSSAGSVSTLSCVAASPPRHVLPASRCHPEIGIFSRPAMTSSRSAPASSKLARAMSPAMPEKQCHQATRVNGRVPSTRHDLLSLRDGQVPVLLLALALLLFAARTDDAGDRPRCAEAVIYPDDTEPGSAAGQHRQQGGDSLERGAVPGAGRDGHHRRGREAADEAGQSPFHPGHDHHGIGRGEQVGVLEQPVHPRHTAIGDQHRLETKGSQRGGALLGHAQVGRPGCKNGYLFGPGRRRAPENRRAGLFTARVDVEDGDGLFVLARLRTTGPPSGSASSSPTISTQWLTDLPGP